MKKNIYSFLFILVFLGFTAPSFAGTTPTTSVSYELKEGSVKFSDLLNACPQIAEAKPAKLVNPAVVGKIIAIGDKKYEVRYFSFEDTSRKLPTTTSFQEYIEKNQLGDSMSSRTEPLPGIVFESFDFRKFKLNDGVYFSMAIREMKE